MVLRYVAGCVSLLFVLTAGLVKASSWELEAPRACGETTRSIFESAPYAIEEQSDGTFVIRIVDGAYRFMDGGDPQIPFLVRRLPVPNGCVAKIEYVQILVSETNAPAIQPVPAHELKEMHGSPHVVPVASAPSAVYETDAFWPPEQMELQYVTQGTQRWARVVINPIQVNPVRGILRWNRYIEAHLTWHPLDVRE